MKLIKFPNAKAPPVVRIEQEATTRLAVGKVSFTCASCHAEMAANFDGMVFRTVELFCAGCGNFFKITNPGFVMPPKSRVPSKR